MKNIDERSQTVTRDNFVNVLHLEGAASHVRDRERVNKLYELVLEFLKSAAASEPVGVENSGDIAFRIPGTAVHFRLTGLLQDSLKDLVTAFLLVEGISAGRHELVLAGLVKTAMEHLSSLETRLGERCVVESLGEITPTTTENVCINLFNNMCRYPGAQCQFMDKDAVCTIQPSASKGVFESLEARKLVRRIRTVDPEEWVIVV
jgi:hypothetical protein